MSNIPVRDLAKGGIVRDVHPNALPLPSWSNGRNVLFENGKALRSPVWRTVFDGVGTNARFCTALTPSTGYDQLIIARDDASLAIYANKVVTEASETGFTPRAAASSPWTSAALGDVLYINRPDGPPRSLLPGGTQFAPLANWPTGWRANVIRQYQDTILALGITVAGASLPTQINVSDIAYFGHVPDSWDTTDPTKLAYSNDLAQLDGPILDGLVLNTGFLFYTLTQTWLMTSGGGFNYNFRKLFSNAGIISTNCVVEVGGLHYVFGLNDIYVTDGNTKKSLADGRVREWIYRTMNKKLSSRFFVQHNPQTNEVMFAHVSGDPASAYLAPTGCNVAWCYNISSDTWAPVDLPNVSSMALCNVDTVLTWGTGHTVTWSGVGGSWYDQQDSRAIHCVGLTTPLNTPGSASVIGGTGTVLGYDFVDRGQLSAQVNLPCCAPSFVERVGIALDFPDQGSAPLNVSKRIRTIYPEVSISRPVAVTVHFGATMTPSGPVDWTGPLPYDPVNDYQIDTMDAGRYLAIRFEFDPLADTEVSGFDVDVVSNGSR